MNIDWRPVDLADLLRGVVDGYRPVATVKGLTVAANDVDVTVPSTATTEPVPAARRSVMRDVALLAGVSHQTVSRVLNGHASVRPETRSRVLDAMRALDYRRNLAARTLVTRRSHTLGLIAFETTLFGPASMLYGIEQAARGQGYFVSVASVRTLERTVVLEAIDRLRDQSVDGITIAREHVAAALTGPAGSRW
jgi:hypothetical protein